MDSQQVANRLAVVQAMADDVEDYLTHDRLFQPLHVQTPGGAEDPVLTLGALLENLETLGQPDAGLDGAQRDQLAAVQREVDQARGRHADAWQRFLQRELNAALDSWKWYLDDAERDAAAADRYAAEVHLRTRIDLLLRVLGNDPIAAQASDRLAALDARLQTILRRGPYIGPRGAESQYPRDRAWWLYGRPPGKYDL